MKNNNNKVLLMIRSLEVSGGSEKVITELYNYFSNKGYDLEIITTLFDKKRCYPHDLSKAKIKCISRIDKLPSFIKSLLHINNPLLIAIQYFCFWLLAVGKTNNCRMIIVNDDFTATMLSVLPTNNVNKVIWYMNHQLSPVIIDSYKRRTSKNSKFINNIRHYVYNKAFSKIHSFAVWSKHNKSLVERYIKRKAFVVYGAADVQKYSKIKKQIRKNNLEFNILSIGVLYPYRRYEDIIKAVNVLKHRKVKCKLTIVGRSDFSKEYLKQIQKLTYNLDLTKEVNFVEFLSDSQKFTAYTNADVFVFVNNENSWGISVFEAVSASIPVVISNNIGAVDIIDDNLGWVVKACDSDMLAKTLYQLHMNPKLAVQKSKLAKKKISKLLTWKAFAERIESL